MTPSRKADILAAILWLPWAAAISAIFIALVRLTDGTIWLPVVTVAMFVATIVASAVSRALVRTAIAGTRLGNPLLLALGFPRTHEEFYRRLIYADLIADLQDQTSHKNIREYVAHIESAKASQLAVLSELDNAVSYLSQQRMRRPGELNPTMSDQFLLDHVSEFIRDYSDSSEAHIKQPGTHPMSRINRSYVQDIFILYKNSELPCPT